MCANKLTFWIYPQIENLMCMEPRKKLENWKKSYALLWTISCNTQSPVANR